MLFLILCNFYSLCCAQQPLTGSRQTSYYTYIYKLGDNEVYDWFYRENKKQIDQSKLVNAVDSFKTGTQWKNILPTGNYIKVYAEKNRLNYLLIEKHSAYLQTVKNNYDLRLTVTDSLGTSLNGCSVFVNNSQLNFDEQTLSYHIKAGKPVVVKVLYAGVTNYFLVQPRGSSPLRFLSARWFNYHWPSLRYIFKHRDRDDDRDYLRLEENDDFTGFMIFNKPIYRPHDTVKFKAYITGKRNGKPIKETRLLVRLQESYNDNGKIIGYVDSYRNGAYEYKFVLADSLGMSLDNNYYVSLEDPSSVKYNVSKHKRDNSEAKNLMHRKIYMVNSFEYQDYELKKIKFSMRADKTEHEPGNPLAVYFRATDENELPVQDGRVKVILTTDYVNRYRADRVFIPDTLWQRKIELEPVGETKLLVPDSIFPKADIKYGIEAEFNNSENELQSRRQQMNFSYVNYKITADLIADSFKVKGFYKGVEIRTPAKIYALDNNTDTALRLDVVLPYSLVNSPRIAKYIIKTDSAKFSVEPRYIRSDLGIDGYQRKDSLYIKVDNPHRIKFSYWLLANNAVIEKGIADSFVYKKKYADKSPVTVVLSYLWGGNTANLVSAIEYHEKLLDIRVKQPLSVYPGQEVKTDIQVFDAFGKPVTDADITAWAVTAKFPQYKAPFVPYLGRGYARIKFPGYVSLHNADPANWQQLNWKKWSREMGLDSVVWYKFTHPRSIYSVEETVPDSVTQVAPFIVNNGDIIPAHIVYIDERPVYFDQAQQEQRYSFRVTPGIHSIKFRTTNNSIVIDSVAIEKGKKLILGINADSLLNKRARFTKMPDSLSQYEAGLLNDYLIIMKNNFGHQPATLEQDGDLILLNASGRFGYEKGFNILAGPLRSSQSTFTRESGFVTPFLAEPGYSYLFEPGLLKQKSYDVKYPFGTNLRMLGDDSNINPGQYAITHNEVEKLWNEYLDLRANSTALFANDQLKKVGGSILEIAVKRPNDKLSFIKSLILYRNDNPEYIAILPGNTRTLNNLRPGSYKLFCLLRDGAYFVADSLAVKDGGRNYYQITIVPHLRDSVSIKLNDLINNRAGDLNDSKKSISTDITKLNAPFNEKFFTDKKIRGEVEGLVLGTDDGLPLPGVSITVKGTQIGTQTNDYGRFKIRVPLTGTLVVSFVGYKRKEIPIKPGGRTVVYMETNSSELKEVVVTGGYNFTVGAVSNASITTISKNNSITGLDGAALTGSKPLIVVDGVIVDSLDGLDPDVIVEISDLKGAAAIAIYGPRAAGGAIIVRTKKKSELRSENDSAHMAVNKLNLRKNFSDYAYWQPKLTTDEAGKASFVSVFPDDITNWRTFIAGINDNRQSGFTEGSIKSFKSVSANLAAPLFVVEGDEFSVIGKILNYTVTPVMLNRTFKYNGHLLKQDTFRVNNSRIDTFKVTAGQTDSLNFEYTIRQGGSSFDGEHREISVIKQGVKETEGLFEALNSDTTVTLKFDPLKGPVTFHAEASVLPVLLAETEKLRDYKYLCNEQLASKLKGLMMEKSIRKFLGEDFKYGKNINDIIKKLLENRKSSGIWGWWKDSEGELWISLHAIEALIDAQKAGYSGNIDKQMLTDYLVYRIESYSGRDKLTCLELLHKLEAKVDYAKYIGAIEKEYTKTKDDRSLVLSGYDKLKIMLLKQQNGISINLDSLLARRKNTMFGNIYWGDEGYSFFDNSVQLTVLAYQIIKNEGKHNNLLPKIQGYFLEQRRSGDWRNTYEAALILETILPDVLTPASQPKSPVLTIKGAVAETITQFPYSTTLKDNEVNISKTGTFPVYITGYQQFWNTKPGKVNKDFTVDTWFEKKDEHLAKLKGGEPVQLKAEVAVKGDADFVMIEVPIPAGCSYESKDQGWQNNEVHREYFKEKVSIFCRKLKQGRYQFTINLLPRYSGKYTLNPAKAEMMYFPVFYGREGMKRVEIAN